MKEKTCKTVRLVSGIVLSAMTVILGALFIWQILDILAVGTAEGHEGFIFTSTDVAARLFKILPAILIWIVLIFVVYVLWEVFPVKQKRGKNDACYMLNRYKKRIPAAVPEELKSSLKYVKGAEENLKLVHLACAALCVVGAVFGLVYLANPLNFPKTDVTAEMLNMVKNISPWVFVALLLWCGAAVYEGISAKKQLEHAKKLAAANKPQPIPHGKIYSIIHHKHFILGVRIAVGCLAAAFFIAGICNGTMHDVLIKAINICTECIGLG